MRRTARLLRAVKPTYEDIPGYTGGFREVGTRGPFPGGEYKPITRSPRGFWRNPPTRLPPWISAGQVLSEHGKKRMRGDERLSYEIHKFVSKFEIAPDEVESREEVVDRFVGNISEILPGSHFQLFGTTPTKLAIPISDIDLNLDIPVEGRGEEIDVLKGILNEMQKRDMVSKGFVVGSAKKRLLRVMDQRSQLTVDITIGDGVVEGKTLDLMRKWQQKYPGLPRLYILTKYMLIMRGLAANANEGGIGSFPLLCWIVSWLESTWIPLTGEVPAGPFNTESWSQTLEQRLVNTPSPDLDPAAPKSELFSLSENPEHNLGSAFLSLLHFLGTFNTRKNAIDPLSAEMTIPKSELPEILLRPEIPYELIIMPHLRELRDTSTPYFMNIASSCSAILSIQYNIKVLLDKLRFRMGQYERGERPEILGAVLNADWKPYMNHREVHRIRWLRYKGSGEYEKVKEMKEDLAAKGTWKFKLEEERKRRRVKSTEKVKKEREPKKSFEESWEEVKKALEVGDEQEGGSTLSDIEQRGAEEKVVEGETLLTLQNIFKQKQPKKPTTPAKPSKKTKPSHDFLEWEQRERKRLSERPQGTDFWAKGARLDPTRKENKE